MKENIKYLTWPIVVVIVILVFREPLAAKLKDSNLSLKLGELFEMKMEQIAQLQSQLEQATRSGLSCEEIALVVQNTTQQIDVLKQEMEVVKGGDASKVEAAIQSTKESIGKAKDAAAAEAAGFKALELGDRQVALEHFQKASQLYPEYHNVSEISKVLQTQSTDTVSKAELKKIVKNHSWGMPADIRVVLKSKAE